jgi:hypothetical protein
VKELRSSFESRSAQPAGDFWEEFKSRADGVNRVEASHRYNPGLQWAAAVAAVLLVVAGYTGLYRPGTATAERTEIKSLDIVVEHTSVFLLEDEQDSGTILWVGGIETEDTSEIQE